MTLQDILTSRDLGKFQKLADSMCARVRATAKQLNKWVTGDSASILKCKVDIRGNALQAVIDTQGKPAQFWQLQTGRKSGKMPPVSALYEWSKNKGITFSNEKDRMSFAWALAKTIAKQGTNQYTTKKFVNVFDNNWTRFERDFDRYVNMWCQQLIKNETDRITKSITKSK